MIRSRKPAALTALAALLLLLGACVSSSDRDGVSTRDDDSSQDDRSDEDSTGDDTEDDDSTDHDTGDDESEDESSDGDRSGTGDRNDPPMGGDRFEWDGDCSEVDGPCEYGDDPGLDRLWEDCADGDGRACDELFFDSPFDSQYEEFGSTCGGRGFKLSCAGD